MDSQDESKSHHAVTGNVDNDNEHESKDRRADGLRRRVKAKEENKNGHDDTDNLKDDKEENEKKRTDGIRKRKKSKESSDSITVTQLDEIDSSDSKTDTQIDKIECTAGLEQNRKDVSVDMPGDKRSGNETGGSGWEEASTDSNRSNLSLFTDNLPRIPSKEDFIKQTQEINLPTVKLLHVGATAEGLVRMIDTFDIQAKNSMQFMFARRECYHNNRNQDRHGKRVPKIGACAGAWVAEATAVYKIFDATARFLYAEADIGINVIGFYAMATAGLATVRVNAGPFVVKAGLSLDTEASFGLNGVGLHILGIGFNIGPTTSVSFIGNEIGLQLF